MFNPNLDFFPSRIPDPDPVSRSQKSTESWIRNIGIFHTFSDRICWKTVTVLGCGEGTRINSIQYGIPYYFLHEKNGKSRCTIKKLALSSIYIKKFNHKLWDQVRQQDPYKNTQNCLSG
jgi:hypothetical protein